MYIFLLLLLIEDYKHIINMKQNIYAMYILDFLNYFIF